MNTEPNVTPRYGARPMRLRLSGYYREPLDAKVARMLGISQARAKRLRLTEVAEAITAILAAGLCDAVKAENFRRQVLVAASAEQAPDLTAALELEAEQADAAESVAEAAHRLDPTPRTLRNRILATREEIARQTALLRALEASNG